jgi:hypothetical protein
LRNGDATKGIHRPPIHGHAAGAVLFGSGFMAGGGRSRGGSEKLAENGRYR